MKKLVAPFSASASGAPFKRSESPVFASSPPTATTPKVACGTAGMAKPENVKLNVWTASVNSRPSKTEIVRVANPHLPEKPDDSLFADSRADTVDLDRPEVTATLRAMFDPVEPICERAARIKLHPENAAQDYTLGWTVDTQRVARWICRFDDQRGREAPMPDYQVDAWKKLVAALKVAPAP